MLPYIVGYTKDDLVVLKAKHRVNTGECSSIEETPECLDAIDHMNWLLNQWVFRGGCDSARIFLTDSSNNFRLDIAFSKPYKGQRPVNKPPFFYELRAYLIDKHDAVLSKDDEADDLMSISMMDDFRRICNELGEVELGSPEHRVFSKVYCITKDKDAKITCGNHVDPDTGEHTWTDLLGELRPKWKVSNKPTADYEYVPDGVFNRGSKKGQQKYKRVKIGESCKPYIDKLKGSGLKFFYSQLIVGDTADNYGGLKGKGMSFAYELLNDCSSGKELFYAVLGAYRDVWGKGRFWYPHYKGTEEYRSKYFDIHGKNPDDWDYWKGRGTMLTAYQLMLEQGRLAWMKHSPTDIWRSKDYCPRTSEDVWKR